MGSAVKLMRIVAQGQRARGNSVGNMDAGVAGGSREAGRKVVAGADCRWCQWMGTCIALRFVLQILGSVLTPCEYRASSVLAVVLPA